jgi:ABC-type Zn uptake system ZnuABC Zn-binding protein ZnuA
VRLLLFIFLVAGCSAPRVAPPSSGDGEILVTHVADLGPATLEPGQKLRVVATTSIVGDVLRQVGGEAIDMQTLMPLGVDPHTYEPTPRDMQVIAQADVVFLSGLGLEEALLPRLVNVGGRAAFVSLSEGITPRGWGAVSTPGGGQTSAGSEGAGVDPHVWQDPRNVMRWTANVSEALSRLDPAGESGYRQRADSYRARLEEMDAEIEAMVATIPADQRKLVTDHDDLGYFADRYGFTVVGAVIPAYSTSAEPSAQEVSRLEDAVGQFGVKAVFVGVEANQALSSQVAQDTGVRLIRIYADSLSPADGPASNYIQLMLYNVAAIVDALR